MNYSVFISDGIDVIELDAEDVMITSNFSVADVADIAVRTDNITKQINFKGTKINNDAFGSLFHLNKVSNFTLSNKLFYNYNPLRTVDCYIYEESVLILRGSLRVLDMSIDAYGNPYYSTVVTGAFIDFKTSITDKLLSDIDLSDLSHQYMVNNLTDSWEFQTERYISSTKTFVKVPFNKGSGYVYPFMDYGLWCSNKDKEYSFSYVRNENLRPAVYVKEYFDRIINAVPGYSYEVKGSADLVKKFNSLIIPNNQEKFNYNLIGKYYKLSTSAPISYSVGNNATQKTNGINYGSNLIECSIPLPQSTVQSVQTNTAFYPTIFQYENGAYNGLANTVIRLNRPIHTSIKVNVQLSHLNNIHNQNMFCTALVVTRPYIAPASNNYNNFSYNISSLSDNPIPLANYPPTDGVDRFIIPANTSNMSKTLSFDIGEKDYAKNTQFILKLWFQVTNGINPNPNVSFTVDSASLDVGKDGYSSTISEYNLGLVGDTTFDVITPLAPAGIKQMDFIKSVIALFNFYVYTDKDKPKHLIFQTYDDYYAFALPQYLKTQSIDWSKKVDYSKGLKITPNVSIPKNYVFTYKDDVDWLNEDYKAQFNEVYGTKTFTDKYGITDTKKVEVIFSPTLMASEPANSKIYPSISKELDGPFANSPTKSNIRILFYNGLKDSDKVWYIVKEYPKLGGADPVDEIVYIRGDKKYPLTSTYYVDGGSSSLIASDSLLFATPKKFWFNTTQDYINAIPVYDNYYIGQTSELTNADVKFIECQIYLNELDINNLDLRTPVFIDMGDKGHSYFKVLSVSYTSNATLSTVKLQRIS